MPRWFWVLVKAGVSVALMWWVLRAAGVDNVLARISTVEPSTLIVALAIMAVLSVLQTLRWLLVLKAGDHVLAFGRALQLVFVGYFFSQLLPSSVGGDAVRAWYARGPGIGLGDAVNSVIVDRILALVALLLLIGCTAPWLIERLPHAAARSALIATAVLGLAGVIGLFVFHTLEPKLPQRQPFTAARKLYTILRRTLLHPGYAVPAVLLSVAVHIGVTFIVFAIAHGLGSTVGLVNCLLLVPPVMLVATLPISIAGWGLRESAMAGAFGLVGMPHSDAVTISLLFGLLFAAFSLPGAVFWHRVRGAGAPGLSPS
jgi:uncharacterized membrane protein YbhN (UPF0104 family)